MLRLIGRSHKTGRRTVILGISEENVARLKDDQPIHMFGQEVGMDFDIVVFYAASEEALWEEGEKIAGHPLPRPEPKVKH